MLSSRMRLTQWPWLLLWPLHACVRVGVVGEARDSLAKRKRLQHYCLLVSIIDLPLMKHSTQGSYSGNCPPEVQNDGSSRLKFQIPPGPIWPPMQVY